MPIGSANRESPNRCRYHLTKRRWITRGIRQTSLAFPLQTWGSAITTGVHVGRSSPTMVASGWVPHHCYQHQATTMVIQASLLVLDVGQCWSYRCITLHCWFLLATFATMLVNNHAFWLLIMILDTPYTNHNHHRFSPRMTRLPDRRLCICDPFFPLFPHLPSTTADGVLARQTSQDVFAAPPCGKVVPAAHPKLGLTKSHVLKNQRFLDGELFLGNFQVQVF